MRDQSAVAPDVIESQAEMQGPNEPLLLEHGACPDGTNGHQHRFDDFPLGPSGMNAMDRQPGLHWAQVWLSEPSTPWSPRLHPVSPRCRVR